MLKNVRLRLSAALLVPALALTAASTDEAEWRAFQQRFGRRYAPEEEHFRRRVFSDNLERIRRHNAQHDAGNSTFRLGVNQFADLTSDEFRLNVLSQKIAPRNPVPARLANTATTDIPDSFDWRDYGVIYIDSYGYLGESSIVCVISAIRAGTSISGGRMVNPSGQNLLDCVSSPSTVGALEYVRDHGIASEEDYPTTGYPGPCRPVPPTVTVDEVCIVPEADELALAEGLLINPAPVMFDASHFSFQLYSSGIYSEPACSDQYLDHGLLLVGYGTSSGTDFWTLANTWGTGWGENGYVRVVRGVNMCGVATMAAYPSGVHVPL